MQRQIVFFVDEITPDGGYGKAVSLSKIFRNLQRLPYAVTKYLNQRLDCRQRALNVFFPTGRYVCNVSFYSKSIVGKMEFFDTRMDDWVVYRIGDGFENEMLRDAFLRCHAMLKKQYLREYDSASIGLASERRVATDLGLALVA